MNASQLPFLADSSVLVKWYHDEEDTPVALRLREGHLRKQWEARVADISLYELANALHFAGKYTPTEIIERIQSLLEMQLQTYGFDLLVLSTALDLCGEKKIAIYDAYLVALAKHANMIFVTADEKFLRKLGSDGPAISLTEFSRLAESQED